MSSNTNPKKKGGRRPRQKGDEFERQTKRYLESKGLFCVRQPRSAFPDLIAIDKQSQIYFIECKINKYIECEERNKLTDLVLNYGGTAVISFRDKDKKIWFCDLAYKNVSKDL